MDQVDPLAEMLGEAERLAGRAADHPGHLVALLEQQLGQERPVLTGDAGHEGAPRLASHGHAYDWSAAGLASDRARPSCARAA